MTRRPTPAPARVALAPMAAVLAVVAVAAVPTDAGAQAFDRWGLGFQVAASVPTGVYAGGEGEDAGHAKTGFGLGLDVQLRLNTELSVLTSVGVAVHPPGQGLLPGDQVAFDAGSTYLLFPILVGPRITARLGPVAAFGTVQVGAVFADGPAEHNVDESNPAPEVREGYDIPPSPSLALGGGMEIPGGWVVGARAVFTPAATFVANTRYPDGSLVDVQSTKAIQYVDVYLGVTFD